MEQCGDAFNSDISFIQMQTTNLMNVQIMYEGTFERTNEVHWSLLKISFLVLKNEIS